MLITYKSKNEATAVASVLNSTGINASVVQLPRKFTNKGCSFGMKINSCDFSAAEKASELLKIKIMRVIEVDGS